MIAEALEYVRDVGDGLAVGVCFHRREWVTVGRLVAVCHGCETAWVAWLPVPGPKSVVPSTPSRLARPRPSKRPSRHPEDRRPA